jgi:hypothetical protein
MPRITDKPYDKDQVVDGVVLTYHHLIPKVKLEEFWNVAICHDHAQLVPIIEALIQYAPTYKFSSGHRISTTDTAAWKILLEESTMNDINPIEFHKFAYVFQWPPGNVVRGPPPGQRGDDPHEGFEIDLCWAQGCNTVFHKPQCELLNPAFEALERYLKTKDPADAGIVAENLKQAWSIGGDGGVYHPDEWEKQGNLLFFSVKTVESRYDGKC